MPAVMAMIVTTVTYAPFSDASVMMAVASLRARPSPRWDSPCSYLLRSAGSTSAALATERKDNPKCCRIRRRKVAVVAVVVGCSNSAFQEKAPAPSPKAGNEAGATTVTPALGKGTNSRKLLRVGVLVERQVLPSNPHIDITPW